MVLARIDLRVLRRQCARQVRAKKTGQRPATLAEAGRASIGRTRREAASLAAVSRGNAYRIGAGAAGFGARATRLRQRRCHRKFALLPVTQRAFWACPLGRFLPMNFKGRASARPLFLIRARTHLGRCLCYWKNLPQAQLSWHRQGMFLPRKCPRQRVGTR